MASDLWRSILCHETNNDTADHRDHDYPEPKMVMPRTAEIGGETMKEEKISKQTYQLVLQKRYESSNNPNTGGQTRNQQHSKLRGRRNHGLAGGQDCEPSSVYGILGGRNIVESLHQMPSGCRRFARSLPL
jgi:hypothetical protein